MDLFPAVLGLLLAASVSVLTLPPLIRKMKEGNMVGRDVNKREDLRVAELGGIAALFAFSISVSLVVGYQKLVGNISEPPYLAVISVFFIASMIGLIDDVSRIRQRVKALSVIFASLPLLLVHFKVGLDGVGTIEIGLNAFIALPGANLIDFRSVPLAYWFVLVPIGVTGVANAMNMSAGYNGLESGQIIVVSLTMFIISAIRGISETSLIFGALIGASLGLFLFNRYPSRVFVGDIGTLGLGAAIAAGVIIGGLESYCLIAIAPAFYEAGATFYYGVLGRNYNRREACQNPVIRDDGKLSPPPGTSRYTLAYFILGKKPMTEPRLVAVLLSLYAISGVVAVLLSLV